MATLQERAAALYTPEYFQQLTDRNAWGNRDWISDGGIREASGNYQHALYRDGTYSPLYRAYMNDADYMQRVAEGTADANTRFENTSAIPLRDLLAQGGVQGSGGVQMGGQNYIPDMERKASDGETGDLVKMIITALTMGYGATAGAGAEAAAFEGGAHLGGGASTAGAYGGAAGGAAAAGDAAWGVNPTAAQYDAGMADYLGLGNSADAGAISNSLTNGEWSWLDSLLKGDGTYTKILNGTANADDYAKLVGKFGPSILGYLGAGKQAQSYGNLGNQFLGLGAPYRKRLADLYANPDSFLQSNEVQKPVQMGTDILARSLSARGGNPIGSGNALQQLQSYSADQLFSRLGQEKDRLGQLGGISTLTAYAPQFQNNAIDSQGQQWDAIGAGMANVFDPPKTYSERMSEMDREMTKFRTMSANL